MNAYKLPFQAAVLGLTLFGGAGAGHADTRLPGYAPQTAQRQAHVERLAVSLADTRAVTETARALAAKPHVAGTDQQIATRDYCLQRLAEWGLETDSTEYEVYLPKPTEIRLERTSPDPAVLDLSEPPIDEDPWSADASHVPPQNGYAAAGDVAGELVYVNYALPEDLAQLREMGVDLTGRIAVARYGRCYRGNKVANVAAAGAVGCILYSDPMDDGYFRGDVYPKGPMRPPRSVQRGSIKLNAGDPTTPGWASVPGAKRIDPADSPDLVKIPVLPIGYGVAAELLNRLEGHDVPQEWQGALSFRYHVGPGPVQVRMRISHDGGYRRIFNTFGRIAGTEFPDEWIIVGAHRDAWCCGALDNVSGVASVMEAARICASLARNGYPPRRTLIFATWDAEEWGIIGSTEWIEQMRDTLSAKAVAYVNQDAVAGGPQFDASASPSLKPLLRELAKSMPSPDDRDKSIYEVWQGSSEGPAPVHTSGGGSDQGPFFLGLGVPSASYGFGGHCGVYHSIYDTIRWMERFGDPEYRRHTATARLTALMALRLANADVLPLDYGGYGDELVAAVADLQKRVIELESGATKGKAPTASLRLAGLIAAAGEFQKSGHALTTRLNAIGDKPPESEQLARINGELQSAEREFIRPEGVCGSCVYRHVLFGVDPVNGYGQSDFPAVSKALDDGDAPAAQREIIEVTERLRAATGHLRAAAALLE